MAEPTLLSMTQDILSSMSSDEVNSIGDSTESMQVATIIKNKYYDITARGQMPEHETLFQLNPSNDNSKPVLMLVPEGVSAITWIKYFDTNPADGSTFHNQFGAYSHDLNVNLTSNVGWSTTSTTSNTISNGSKTFTVATAGLAITVGQAASAISGSNIMFGTVVSYVGTTLVLNITSSTGSGTFSSWTISSGVGTGHYPGYLYVTIIPIEQFTDMSNKLNPTERGVASFNFNEGGRNFTFYYRSDHQPHFCTVLENSYVIFDAFDSTQDSTLQTNKTMCFGQIVPSFQMTDSFVPELDDQQFPLLMNEAKALAFYEIKQQPHTKADQEVKRQWSSVQKSKSLTNKPSYFDQLPSFGRMPRTGGYGTLWPKITRSMN